MRSLQGFLVTDPPRLRKVGDLVEYDGPVLSEFRCDRDQPYLFLSVDHDAVCWRWLVFRVDEEDLLNFVLGVGTLRDLVRKQPDVFVVDIDAGAHHRAWYRLPVKRIPRAYVPTEFSRYPFDTPPDYRTRIA